MVHQKSSCVGRNLLLLKAQVSLGFTVHLFQEMIDEKPDVPHPITQWRQLQNRYGQPVEKILAKRTISDLLRQGSIGGRDYSHVYLDRLAGSQAHHLALLEDTQKFHLDRGWKFTELIKE